MVAQHFFVDMMHVAAGFNIIGTPHPVPPSPVLTAYTFTPMSGLRRVKAPLHPISLFPDPPAPGSLEVLEGRALVGVGGQWGIQN